jgi:hypothetical protein
MVKTNKYEFLTCLFTFGCGTINKKMKQILTAKLDKPTEEKKMMRVDRCGLVWSGRDVCGC